MNKITRILSNKSKSSNKNLEREMKEHEPLTGYKNSMDNDDLHSNFPEISDQKTSNTQDTTINKNKNKNQKESRSKSELSINLKYANTKVPTVMEFATDYGTQRVTIHGDINSGRPIIATYHDIGINHNGCFSTFFNMVRSYDSIFQFFTIVHIDAPGHHYFEDNSNFEKRKAMDVQDAPDIDSYDLLELSTQIEEIRSKLGMDRFIGFGIGAGCNVWTYYAINYSHRLRGIILINPVGGPASWREFVADQLLNLLGEKSQYLRDSISSSLLSRYFVRPVGSDTSRFYLDEFDKIDRTNVIKYFRGFVRRKEFSSQMLNKIKCKILVICGEYSKVKDDTLSFQRRLPRNHTSTVIMRNAGFLLTETMPQKLISSIDLFTQSLGISKLSMEMKYGKIVIDDDDDDKEDGVEL